MTRFVVDASVAAKWFFAEEHSSEARRLLSKSHELLAPDLIWSELGNIAWKKVRRSEITPDEAMGVLGDALQTPLVVTDARFLICSALDLALASGRTTYDCMYLALAIGAKCRMATADDRLFNALASTPLAKHLRHVSSLARR